MSTTFRAIAQENDKNNVVKETRDLPVFNKIDVGGAFEVLIEMGQDQSVIVETEQKNLEKISTEVKDNLLEITSRGILKPRELKIYLVVEDIEGIFVSGACDLESTGTIKADMLELRSSGASDVSLDIETDNLSSSISGAATVYLSGKAEQHSLETSGASTLKAADLETQTTVADLSGASSAIVFAKQDLVAELSGSAAIDYKG